VREVQTNLVRATSQRPVHKTRRQSNCPYGK
jgi:hypothetical protein